MNNAANTALFPTREEWLLAGIEEVRPMFQIEGHPLPEKIRVTCGFPSTASRSGAIGQCFASVASKDAHYEILVSPVLDDARAVFAVLIHELVHTLPGCMNHGKTFQTAAHKVHLMSGLSSKGWGASIPGPTFDGAFGEIIKGLGAYPHARLDIGQRKKQGTRLLKAVCPCCGYTIRVTKVWADKGLPICSLDGATMTLA